MQPNNYLLIAADSETFSGKRASAWEIVQFRLEVAEWPLYSGTFFSRQIAPNDRLLIYCAGAKTYGSHVVAKASVGRIETPKKPHTLAEAKSFLNEPAAQLIMLEDSELLAQPVKFRSILEQLDCCPSNLGKWGAILQGGVRKLSDHDYDLINQIKAR